jgi:hypothetical protein
VQLKLRATVFVAAGVVESNAALPELGSAVGHKLDEIIKTCGGFHNAAALEIGDSAVEDLARILTTGLSTRARNGEEDSDNSRRKSHRFTF